jgi:hypothetical protein
MSPVVVYRGFASKGCDGANDLGTTYVTNNFNSRALDQCKEKCNARESCIAFELETITGSPLIFCRLSSICTEAAMTDQDPSSTLYTKDATVPEEPTTRGGDHTGDNNCVLETEDETECQCECSTADYSSGKCEYSPTGGIHDGIGKMTELNPMYKICQSKVCSTFQEKKQCDFLGDSSDTDHSKQRYFAERGLCTGRQTTKPLETNYCGTLADHCGIDAAGQCVSKYVECNAAQQQKFDEKKEIYLRSLVPKQCLTDQAGMYGDEKATKQFLDHAGLIVAGIVTLSITTLFIFLLALSMQMNGDDGSKKNSVAVAPIGLRSWDAGK